MIRRRATRSPTQNHLAAHECGHFVAGTEFSAGCRNYLTHALNSADLSRFGPLAFTHVGFGVIYAKSFDRDQDVPNLRLRIGEFLITRPSSPPKPSKTIPRICSS